MKTTNILALGLAAVVALSGTSALASGDGAKLFKKKCGSCHSMEAGKHMAGPALDSIIGRKAGSSDFGSYKALAGADFTWDEKNMDEWITDPKKFIGKATAMTAKIKKEDEREAIIKFLKGEDD